jgi:uncharacterized protein YeaO (DUF488 family)
MPDAHEPQIKLKRAYEDASAGDGLRLLVERLWPRGVRREAAGIDHWFKNLAPSTELRRWYDHDVELWPEFRRRYTEELGANDTGELAELLALCAGHSVSFVFAARDTEHNSAVVLREYVLNLLKQA